MGSASGISHLFDDLPERDRSPLRVRWWVCALALHGALLGLPVAWHEAGYDAPPSDTVAVTLLAPPAVIRDDPIEPEVSVPEDREAPSIEPGEAPPETPAPPQSVSGPVPEETARKSADTPLEPMPEPEAPSLDVQRLLETVAAMDWSVPEERELRAPGRVTESDIVDTFRRPVLALTENTFDGMAAPSDVEITDRWISPGGEHNVVIRAPDGNSYCGRQAPADDLRPWLQMPMLFHRCAGGGKRSDRASWRNN